MTVSSNYDHDDSEDSNKTQDPTSVKSLFGKTKGWRCARQALQKKQTKKNEKTKQLQVLWADEANKGLDFLF